MASRDVNANSDNCNFDVRNVNEGDVNANNLFNSNDNPNDEPYELFPIDSISLWLYNKFILYKGRIETNYILSLRIKVIKLKQIIAFVSKEIERKWLFRTALFFIILF